LLILEVTWRHLAYW